MRTDHHVRHREERVVQFDRLDLEDIEPRAAEMSGAQRVDQHGPLVDDRPARGVDHPCALLQLRQPLSVQQVVGLLPEEGVDEDVIGLLPAPRPG